jgi:hypothetical protein
MERTVGESEVQASTAKFEITFKPRANFAGPLASKIGNNKCDGEASLAIKSAFAVATESKLSCISARLWYT